ncbi:MAG: NAD(P)H-hydrate epimerase, partial [Anaerolineales bacterium]
MKFVTVEEMKAIEREANEKGLSYEMMMENAGTNLGKIVEQEFALQKTGGVLGLVGSGNNGGDTLVALAYLADQGWRSTAYLVKERSDNDPLVEEVIRKGGKIFTHSQDHDFTKLKILLHENDIILDGILGTGFHLPLRDDLAVILRTIKETIEDVYDPLSIIAVDCPSGVDCDTGEAAEEVLQADLTVTMAAIKIGLMRLPAYKLCGKIVLASIGNLENLENWNNVNRFILTQEWITQKLPQRPEDSHKGTFGTTLIIAGSKNYTGAAYLAAKAAYLSGCGLVTL